MKGPYVGFDFANKKVARKLFFVQKLLLLYCEIKIVVILTVIFFLILVSFELSVESEKYLEGISKICKLFFMLTRG